MVRHPPMTTANRSVLVTDSDTGQNRSALAAVRALAAAGYEPVVATAARHSIAAGSRHCAARLSVPPVRSADYAARIRTELARRPYLCVLPSSDATLIALDEPGQHLLDKERLAQRAGAVGIPFPAHRLFASGLELRAAAGQLDYPVAIKLVVRGPMVVLNVTRADTASDLEDLPLGDDPVLVQRWIDEPMQALAGVAWQGSFAATVHQRYLRTWPVEAGVACAAMTTEPDLQLEQQVLSLLGGFDGIFQAQFVGGQLIDLNPRVYGSLPLAVASGANLPAILCELTAGRAPPSVRARVGVRYRWVEGDVRHLLAGLRAGRLSSGEVATALRPRRSSAHSVIALRDPGPVLARLRFTARGKVRA